MPDPSRAQGFVAKPVNAADGSQDILTWDVVIPGKDGTLWEGARIPMTMCAHHLRPQPTPAVGKRRAPRRVELRPPPI